MKKINKYLVKAGDDLEILKDDILLSRYVGIDEKDGLEILQIWCIE